MRHSVRFIAGCCVVTCICLAVSGSARAEDPRTLTDEPSLIAILDSDGPKADKALACKRLAVFGGKAAVAALATLLSDKELSSWARIALEAIPDASVDEALRENLKTLDGRLLVAVINSIGVRRDAGAVPQLKRHLASDDPQVAAAAAIALGRAANDASAEILTQALSDARPQVRSAVAQGCILCAEEKLRKGQSGQAEELYERVRSAEVPPQRQLEATRGVILSQHPDSVRELATQLQAKDPELFGIALRTSREMTGGNVTRALVDRLAEALPGRRPMLIQALAERDDEFVLPAISAAAKSGPRASRAGAIAVLARVGNVSSIPTLLDAATSDDQPLIEAALHALESLPGEDVDQELVARLRHSKGGLRHALIQTVGRRRVDAVAELLMAIDDDDQQIRNAALTALGQTMQQHDLHVLVERVVSPKRSADTQAAQNALRVASVRMPDREACADLLSQALSKSDVATQIVLLENLSRVGGSAALDSVTDAALAKQPELRDVASRLLGQWMNADAAPALLTVAKTSAEQKYRVRALRGYLRIVRQFSLPNPKRVGMCRAAMDVAERDTERSLVLEVLQRYPSMESLVLAVDIGKQNPALKQKASEAMAAIVQEIGGEEVDVEVLLKKLKSGPLKIEIVSARYGVREKILDVTKVLRAHIGTVPLIQLPSSSFNESFGRDPAPGIPKVLTVQYRINNQPGSATFKENAVILLPVP